MQNKIICFIPCCKKKVSEDNIIKPENRISKIDLPKTWENLEEGRKIRKKDIDSNSPETIAINLYDGKFYHRPLSNQKDKIVTSIKSGKFRLIIISACYGIIDALEPIQKYEAKMQGKVASEWKRMNLEGAIADLLLQEKPTHIYGFFVGKSDWSSSNSTYRYFFTEGVRKALRNGLNTELSGCFFREKGGGHPQYKELEILGDIFIRLVYSNFKESDVKDLKNGGLWVEDIKIGFDEISL